MGGRVQQEAGPVGRLFFGRDDAESDLADGLLNGGVFQQTRAYEAALSGRKSLIIGRKGAGKSAICRQLASPHGHPGPTVLITPDDAAGEEIRRFELQGVSGDTAKSLIWRYVFAVHAARHLCTHARAAHGWRTPASVKALRSFLDTNDEAGEERLYDRLRRGVRGLQAANLSLKAFGVEAAVDVAGTSEGARASRQLEVLESGVSAAFAELRCATEHPPLLVLVDQLEQVWTIEPDSHALVTGLLLAAKQVTSYYGGAVRCLLFIRADIYDTLNFGDGDKFRSDELPISWTLQGLQKMALARAGASLGMGLTPEQLWGELFPPTVAGEEITGYLFQRALPRPRDAIQLLNACRDVADERGNQRITEEDVVTATERFSRWKLQDLAKEYQVNHPFLRSLFPLFENTGYVVMRQALEARFAARGERLRQDFPDYAVSLSPQGLIDVLYGTGFLGVKRGHNVVFTGESKAPPQPGEDEFHVHPCFRPALGSQGPVELTAYVPAQGRGQVVGHSNTAITLTGSDAALAVGRDVNLLNEVVRSCERLLRRLPLAGLPDATRVEVHAQVSHVLQHASTTREELRAGADVAVAHHVLSAAGYLDAVAVQLADHGFREEALTRRFSEEARLLIRSVGGAVGGGGGSDSTH